LGVLGSTWSQDWKANYGGKLALKENADLYSMALISNARRKLD